MTFDFILNTYKTERYKLYSDVYNNDKVSGVLGFTNYLDYFEHYLGYYAYIENTELLIEHAVRGIFKYKLKDYVHPHHKNFTDRGGIEKIRRRDADEALINTISEKMDEFERVIKSQKFIELYDFIRVNKASNLSGLDIYDVALRIGIKYNIKPTEVFLHKGVLMGLKMLESKHLVEEDVSLKKTVSIKDLPKVLWNMEATYIEDFFNVKNRDFMKI